MGRCMVIRRPRGQSDRGQAQGDVEKDASKPRTGANGLGKGSPGGVPQLTMLACPTRQPTRSRPVGAEYLISLR